MIFIDDDTWPPSLHGTGTEDYFNHAWGMQRQAYPYHGAIVHEGDVPGYAVSYRFHVVDPIRFSTRIAVTVEHGHANHLADDWSSTAYWYQVGTPTVVTIAPVERRLPPRPSSEPVPAPSAAPAWVADEAAEVRAELAARKRRFDDNYRERIAVATSRAAEQEATNAKAAQELRARFR